MPRSAGFAPSSCPVFLNVHRKFMKFSIFMVIPILFSAVRHRKSERRLPSLAIGTPAPSREAASFLAHGERYSANHGTAAPSPISPVKGRRTMPLGRYSHRVMTPLAGLGCCGTLNPWFAEYRSPWAKNDAASRLCAGTPTRGRGGQFALFLAKPNQPHPRANAKNDRRCLL